MIIIYDGVTCVFRYSSICDTIKETKLNGFAENESIKRTCYVKLLDSSEPASYLI